MFIGEVRYMWPDITNPKAQIQWSALVSGLMTTDFVAITRWVTKDGSPPDVGACIPAQEFPGDGKKLDLMYWVKLPFADDDHKFFFPSLTQLKSVEGKAITEHPYLPTEEQCDLMDELVREMDLDRVGRQPKKDKEIDSDDEEEEEEEEEEEDDDDWLRMSEGDMIRNDIELADVKSRFEDEVDMFDTTMVAEYAEDIFKHMEELELSVMPNPRYMDFQTEIEW
jgi:hypothetical protein